MIGKLAAILCLWLAPAVTLAAGNNWYVDPNATGGNNGTSWANAWKSPAAISWGAVQPGDTVYLSGGTSSQTYTTPLTVGKSGASGNPITIKAGQDAGHNGQVIFDAGGSQTAMISMGGYQYLTIDGNYNGARNIIVQNEDMTGDYNIVYGSGGGGSALSQGIHLTYIEVRNSGTGIRFNYGKGGEIDHVYVHNISCEAGIALNGSLGNYSGDMSQYNLYDQGWLVHDSIIQVNNDGANDGYGPDAVQGTHGLSIYNNTIYGAPGVKYCGQHQDGVQIGGEFYKIYGNTMYGLANSDSESDSADSTTGFLHYYNNVFEQTSTQVNSHGIELQIDGNATRMTDVRVYNNTFTDYAGFIAVRILNARGSSLTAMDNIVIQNNIIYNSGPYSLEVPGQFCTNGAIVVDSNNINPGSSGGTVGTCSGSNFSDTNRKTSAPSFMSYSPYAVSTNDLHLAPSSTVDSGAGISLASLFTTDKDGALRTIPWSLGAYNFGGTSAGKPTPPTNVVATVQQ